MTDRREERSLHCAPTRSVGAPVGMTTRRKTAV
jgi:hypothetical protein